MFHTDGGNLIIPLLARTHHPVFMEGCRFRIFPPLFGHKSEDFRKRHVCKSRHLKVNFDWLLHLGQHN